MHVYLQQMFGHVVAEIFEQSHLLVECLGIQLESVKELGAVSLYVLYIPATQTDKLSHDAPQNSLYHRVQMPG